MKSRKVQSVIRNAVLILSLVLMALPATSVAVDEQVSAPTEAAKRQIAKPADPMSVGSLLQVSSGLIIVLIVIFGAGWLVKRSGGFQTGATGVIRVVAGMSTGPRERIVLVQVGEQQLLLGMSPGRIQTLHVLDKPIQVSKDADLTQTSFAERFQFALQQRLKS